MENYVRKTVICALLPAFIPKTEASEQNRLSESIPKIEIVEQK
jgi:hypothetical protein